MCSGYTNKRGLTTYNFDHSTRNSGAVESAPPRNFASAPPFGFFLLTASLSGTLSRARISVFARSEGAPTRAILTHVIARENRLACARMRYYGARVSEREKPRVRGIVHGLYKVAPSHRKSYRTRFGRFSEHEVPREYLTFFIIQPLTHLAEVCNYFKIFTSVSAKFFRRGFLSRKT